MRRFDIPAAPPLVGGRGDLLRLVDPRGLAVAWLDLRAGRVIGYATRPAGVTVGGWRELLGGGRERDGAERGTPDADALAVGWPWIDAPPLEWPTCWHLIERDPTATTLACRCERERERDQPLVADLALGVSLDDGVLRLRLVARAKAPPADFRAQFRLIVPRTSAEQLALNSSITTIDRPETFALQRAEAAWRLLVTPEPECVVTLAIDDEAGTSLTLSATSQHTDTDREIVCALTTTITLLA